MLNIKRLSMIASLLLLIGIIGSLSTYQFISKPESLTEEITDDFTDIEISANDGKIELVPTNEMTARIEVSGDDLKNNFSTAMTDSTLAITYKESSKKFFNFDFTKKSASVKVYLPNKAFNSLSLRANSGKLTVKEIEANEMDLNANNGSIDLQNVNADALSLKANNGRITLKNIATDSASIVSHNGKIELAEVTGALLAKANNGSMKIFGEKKSHSVFGSGKSKIDLSSNNGKIVVEKQ